VVVVVVVMRSLLGARFGALFDFGRLVEMQRIKGDYSTENGGIRRKRKRKRKRKMIDCLTSKKDWMDTKPTDPPKKRSTEGGSNVRDGNLGNESPRDFCRFPLHDEKPFTVLVNKEFLCLFPGNVSFLRIPRFPKCEVAEVEQPNQSPILAQFSPNCLLQKEQQKPE
jgi:hypothetical protein